MKSAMTYSFSQVPTVQIPRSQFNRSHGHKTTFNAGDLVPVYCDEVLPGDTFNLKMDAFARLATPIAPLMDNLYLDSFFFFVPNRLVQDNFVKMMGEQVDPDDSIDFELPYMVAPAGGYTEGSLYDYFGLPTKIAGIEHNSVYHRAYNLIWNQFFRDQNLQDSVVVDRDDGPDDPDDYVLLKRGKRHDYFTSCLPWAQKGDAVTLPLGNAATVVMRDATEAGGKAGLWCRADTDSMAFGANQDLYAQDNTGKTTNQAISAFHKYNPNGTLEADLNGATAATINSIREAFQIQRMLERDARGGTRYIELNKSHFGVVSPDARLQRPEFLGGGSQLVSMHPVAQTSATSGSNALGQLAGFGTCGILGHGFKKSFTEHGVIIGLISARADLNYQNCLHRKFTRMGRLDFYLPVFANLGEQVVFNKEVYCQGPAAVNPATSVAYDEEAFGYQERFAEYRYFPSQVTGLFRSNCTAPLDIWHLAQKFTALPELGDTFIQENPPMARVKAVVTQPDFIIDMHFGIISARPMPMYSVPGLIDHF